MKVLSVVGARPNFMKVAPLHEEMVKRESIESIVVHTGQHYDAKMSDVFFNQLGLPDPDYYLGIGGGSHAVATAKVMIAFDDVLLNENPDVVLVVGDVNPTLACGLVATKRHFPVVHVEAGLRSGDMSMPEEVNRRCVDIIADHLFVTEQSGLDNLKAEGTPEEKVHFVGNVMIDSLAKYLPIAEKLDTSAIIKSISRFPDKVEPSIKDGFLLVTMHRPSNVDTKENLNQITLMLEELGKDIPIVFAVHPRTYNNAVKTGVWDTWALLPNLVLTEPVGYLEFIHLLSTCTCMLTDSGGIQEETSYLGKQCYTFRSSTERPITVTSGTNVLMDELNPQKAIAAVRSTLSTPQEEAPKLPFWDGKASGRIIDILEKVYGQTTHKTEA